MHINHLIERYQTGERYFYDGEYIFGRLSEIVIEGVVFQQVNFSFGRFWDVRFENCQFFECKFERCEFLRVQFERCKFSFASFQQSRLVSSTFAECHTSLLNLTKSAISTCRFVNSQLRACDLSWSQVSLSAFDHSVLTGSGFAGSKLYECSMTGAVLDAIKLEDTDLHGTTFDSASLLRTCLDPTNKPNGLCGDFEQPGMNWARGYRPEGSKLDEHKITTGEYHAKVFSTSDNPTHPGIYVFPDVRSLSDWIRRNALAEPIKKIVKVLFRPWQCHRVETPYGTVSHRVPYVLVEGDLQ